MLSTYSFLGSSSFKLVCAFTCDLYQKRDSYRVSSPSRQAMTEPQAGLSKLARDWGSKPAPPDLGSGPFKAYSESPGPVLAAAWQGTGHVRVPGSADCHWHLNFKFQITS